jgi:creatinine amidohydrolase
MRLEDLNWMDVESYLKRDDRLILVIGACEQHGYLSLLSDVKTPLALAEAAAKKCGVLIAPPVNFGSSPYFLTYPGTLSLSLSTLLAVVEELVRSAYGQGFRRMLVLNGHGGNSGLKARLTELANLLPGLQVVWYAWWTAPSVLAVADRYHLRPEHANWLEAFHFNRVAELPVTEKMSPQVRSEVMDAATAREVYGDGSFGGPYQAGIEVMQEIFNAALQDIVQLLEFKWQRERKDGSSV